MSPHIHVDYRIISQCQISMFQHKQHYESLLVGNISLQIIQFVFTWSSLIIITHINVTQLSPWLAWTRNLSAHKKSKNIIESHKISISIPIESNSPSLRNSSEIHNLLRRIVNICFPTYQLVQYFSNIQRKLTGKTLKRTFVSFCEVGPNDLLVSFNVSSILPHVSILDSVTIIRQLLPKNGNPLL